MAKNVGINYKKCRYELTKNVFLPEYYYFC